MFKNLIDWSKEHYSHLPWRKKRTLYKTLVSEIMLQQTTVGTVLNHFDRFLNVFPTLESLAKASDEEVTQAWRGLGYYRRARNLAKACRKIQEIHLGKIPRHYEELIKIDGIGDYTASALLSIGMNKKALAIDANLQRVLSRVYALNSNKGPQLMSQIHQLFKQKKIVPVEDLSWRELNEALMDLGRVVCKAREAHCHLCPLSKICQGKKNPLQFPVETLLKENKKPIPLHLIRVLVKRGNKILMYQKSSAEWLSGQFELPTFILKSKDDKLNQYPQWKGEHPEPHKSQMYKTTITKYKIENHLMKMKAQEIKSLWDSERSLVWIDLEKENAKLSSSTMKALKLEGSGKTF